MAGLAGNLAGGNLRYAATSAPTVSSVTPNHGLSIGGEALVIAGTHLDVTTVVQIGGHTCTSIVRTSAIRIDCVAPIGVVGARTLTVRSRGGSATKAYTFDNSVSIDSITPDNGSITGGDQITIIFTEPVAAVVESVTFDGNDATWTVFDDSTIVATAPSGVKGSVDVVVDCGDYGSDTASAGYTYDLTFTSVTPDHGGQGGGTSLSIVGLGLSSVTSVTVGGVAATSLVHTDDTHLTCVTGVHAAGAVDIVLDAGAQGSTTAAAAYTYQTEVTLSSVTANSGTHLGGTVVTLVGAGFTNVTSVTFGGVAATSLVHTNDTHMNVTTPAHAAGAVNVVADAGVHGSATLTNGFTYT